MAAHGCFIYVWDDVFIIKNNSFPLNVEFWAEPRNFYVFAECCRIQYWLVTRAQIWHFLVWF